MGYIIREWIYTYMKMIMVPIVSCYGKREGEERGGREMRRERERNEGGEREK